jgi:hypothetical protein
MPEPKIGENRGNAGKGRPKGVPNKTTKAIKEAVQEAFERAGGVDYLVGLANTDPRTFCGLVAKVIPLQVEGSLDLISTTKEQRDAAVAAATRADR